MSATGLFAATRLPCMLDTASLGALGLTTGTTAWVGVYAVLGAPRKGDTVVLSGVAGAVGSIAAQLFRLRGAKVIGIAGGPRKAVWLRGELGLDRVIDYQATESVGVRSELAAI